MTRYRIVVQGAFGSVINAGKELQRGFYAACFVAAESELQASEMAVGSMQSDPRVDKLKLDWNNSEIALTVEEVTQLTDDDEFDESPQGFVVYDESARA